MAAESPRAFGEDDGAGLVGLSANVGKVVAYVALRAPLAKRQALLRAFLQTAPVASPAAVAKCG